MSDWIEWRGGENPLDGDGLWEYRHRDGHISRGPAKKYLACWSHDRPDRADIVAYRDVSPPAPAPKGVREAIAAEVYIVLRHSTYTPSTDLGLVPSGDQTVALTIADAILPHIERLSAERDRLRGAAKEGLICAEADVEAARSECIEHGEDPETDQFVRVFTERRDLIRAALAQGESRQEGERP